MAEESPIKSTASGLTDGISGYDFVKKVFESHHDDVIETLLSYAGNDECDFLEFKAGVEAPPDTLKPGEKQEDLYWNYSREIIAMINSRGGLFVLGVSDDRDHHVVPLETNDSGSIITKKGLEAYIREVIDLKLLPKGKSWKYKGNKYVVEEDLEPYIEHKRISYQGHVIFGYLVKPREDGEFVYVQPNKNGVATPEIVLARRKGEIGEAMEYSGHANISAYQRERQIRSTILAADVLKFEFGHSQGSSGAYRLKQLKEGSEDAESHKLLQLTRGLKLTSEFKPGYRIAGYEILAKIGSGGMGAVYRVRKPMQQQEFALKAFTPPQGTVDLEPMKKRFITEAQMLGTLKHAYIPHLHEINFDAPACCLFFVMDLIESSTPGECHSLSCYTLAPENSENKIVVSDEQAIRWLRELCEIVGHLHSLGVVHRDIKLSNVMIGKDQHVYLTDFGIIKVSDEALQKQVDYEVTLTYTQGYNTSKPQIGTMAYLAPEVRHKESKASSKSDVWAIGITFFKLVSGQWFEGQQLNKSNWCVRHDLWFPLLSTMLEHDPADRPTCDDILDILRIQECLHLLNPEGRTGQCNTQLKTILDRPITESMVIAGGVGIGKTTIALHKALQIRSLHGDVLFLSKFAALKNQLQEKCQGTSLITRILTAVEWEKAGRPEADLLIVSDAQDFTKDDVDRFIKSARKSIIFIGDDNQAFTNNSTHLTLEVIARILNVPVTRLTPPSIANDSSNPPAVTALAPWENTILLDANNIALSCKDGQGLLVLYAVAKDLQEKGHTVRIYAQPSLRARYNTYSYSSDIFRYFEQKLGPLRFIESSGSDYTMLQDCADHNCEIISNDSFRDYAMIFPWLATSDTWGMFPICNFIASEKKFTIPRLGITIDLHKINPPCLVDHRESYPYWWESEFELPATGLLTLVLDTSGSMAGDKINHVNKCLSKFLESSEISISRHRLDIEIIAFGESAYVLQPLTRIMGVPTPHLFAAGGTATGNALRLTLRGLIERSNTQHPTLVCLLTDGLPTDDIESITAEFKSYIRGKQIQCICGYLGPESEMQQLQTTLPFFDFHPISSLRGIDEFFKLIESATSQFMNQNTP